MEDRAAINEELKINKFFPDFFSVLLPELGRPQYLKKCLDSIHAYADMPVEIIVHDDGSGAAKQQEIVACRDQISTLILNHGHNMGLARSLNRCRAVASSPYLVGFNTDTYMTSPFLFNMKAALDLPYVGMVNVVPSLGKEGPGIHVTPGGIKVGLASQMGSFHAAGIRAEVWDEVGGWDTEVQTTSSDGGFMGNLFGAGYFGVRVEGSVINEMWADDGKKNTGGANAEYVGAATFCRDDVNVPPIFKMSPAEHTMRCSRRWQAIYAGVNTPRLADPNWASWYSGTFLGEETRKLFRGPLDIDWEFAKTYGHDRWKDRIIQDFNL